MTVCHSSENKPRSGFVDQNTHFHLPWCRWQPAWLIAMKTGSGKPVVGATLVVVRSRRQPVFIPLCGLRKAMVIPSAARNLGWFVVVFEAVSATELRQENEHLRFLTPLRYVRNDIRGGCLMFSLTGKRRCVFNMKTHRLCSYEGPITSPDAKLAASLSSCG